MHNIIPKLIKADTFLENKKRYLGTLILVNMLALSNKARIPSLVDSTK